MKSLICLAMLFSEFAHAQKLPYKDNKIYYYQVVTVDSISKTDLYSRARKWIVDMYPSAKDVLQMDDKEAGQMAAKASFHIFPLGNFDDNEIKYTITVSFKDGKYKYAITDFFDNNLYLKKEYTMEEHLNALVDPSITIAKIDEKVKAIILSLQKAMSIKNDW